MGYHNPGLCFLWEDAVLLAGMQAMQDHEKTFNRGLGWVAKICTVDAEGVKPAKTGI